MTDKEQSTIWNEGFDAYTHNKPQTECPEYPEQEKRDEWMSGWFAAQSADMYYLPPDEREETPD